MKLPLRLVRNGIGRGTDDPADGFTSAQRAAGERAHVGVAGSDGGSLNVVGVTDRGCDEGLEWDSDKASADFDEFR